MKDDLKPAYRGSACPVVRSNVARAGGNSCLAKYGRDHFAALGRKGGLSVSQDRNHMAAIAKLPRRKKESV